MPQTATYELNGDGVKQSYILTCLSFRLLHNDLPLHFFDLIAI